MSNPTRWKARGRFVAAGSDAFDLYTPLAAGDLLNVRQLRVSASAACEVVVYFTSSGVDPASAAAIPADDIVFGATFGANGGAAPDLGCLGAWPDSAGDRLRVYVSAAATVHVAAEGTVDD
jgi:hypothetical protein